MVHMRRKMETKTLYHVTDAAHVESIQEHGLKGDNRGYVFVTDSVEEALHIGEIYPTIESPAVFEAEIEERHLIDDPDPHGDLNSWACTVDIPSCDLELVEGEASDGEMTDGAKERLGAL